MRLEAAWTSGCPCPRSVGSEEASAEAIIKSVPEPGSKPYFLVPSPINVFIHCCFSRPYQRKACLPNPFGNSGRATWPALACGARGIAPGGALLGIRGTVSLHLRIFHEAKKLHPDQEDACQAGDPRLGEKR